jgi:hypothetical protein
MRIQKVTEGNILKQSSDEVVAQRKGHLFNAEVAEVVVWRRLGHAQALGVVPAATRE